MDKESKAIIVKGLIAIPYWAIGLHISMMIFDVTIEMLNYIARISY